MTYPPLDLEKALNGAPVAMIWGAYNVQKVYLHKSKNPTTEFPYLIEVEESGRVVLCEEDTIKKNARMWEKSVVFKHWDIIKSDYISMIKKNDDDGFYFFEFETREGLTTSLHPYSFKQDFFPDCPTGTVIKRPEEEA